MPRTGCPAASAARKRHLRTPLTPILELFEPESDIRIGKGYEPLMALASGDPLLGKLKKRGLRKRQGRIHL